MFSDTKPNANSENKNVKDLNLDLLLGLVSNGLARAWTHSDMTGGNVVKSFSHSVHLEVQH